MKLLLFVVWFLLLPTWAFAQFQLDIEQVAFNSNKTEEVEVPQNPQPQNQPGWRVDQNLDSWVFNQHGNAAAAKRHIENQLKAKLASFSNQFELSSDQKQKMLLAGRGDIADFFSELETIRAEFEGVKDQQKINQVFTRIQPLQLRMQQGLFEGDSIMSKITLRTLDGDQRETHEESEKKRTLASYRAAIKMTISELDKSAPFTAAQRKEIVSLLEGTPIPKSRGQYLTYYVLYQLSNNRKQLEGILEPGQMKHLKQALTQGDQMAQFLRQNGFID